MEITNKIGYVTSNESLFPGGNGFFLRFANLCSNSSIIVPQENLWKEVSFYEEIKEADGHGSSSLCHDGSNGHRRNHGVFN